MTVQSVSDIVGIPGEVLLGLAGVEQGQPHIARCLLIDPPVELIDLITDWTGAVLASGSIGTAVAAASTRIRLGAIGNVRPHRNRTALKLMRTGVAAADAVRIADQWIDFGSLGDVPLENHQSAIVFGRQPDRPADLAHDLATIVTSEQIRTTIFVGHAPWTLSIAGSVHRAAMVEFLTLQLQLGPTNNQLLMFEISNRRPPCSQVRATAVHYEDRWEELRWWEETRRSLERVDSSGDKPRLHRWTLTEAPRPLGYQASPWAFVPPRTNGFLNRLDRNYPRLHTDDAAIGMTGPVDPIWLLPPATGEPEIDLVAAEPIASPGHLTGPETCTEPFERLVCTRDDRGEVLPLNELDTALRTWIYHRTDTFTMMLDADPDRSDVTWWESPDIVRPTGPYVALPVLLDQGEPTVFDADTWPGPDMVWLQSHHLDAETVAALLTSGPAREHLVALAPIDELGRPVVSVEVVTALKLPRRVHPLIQSDLQEAYRANDRRAITRLAEEIYSGNERALLEHRDREGPSLFTPPLVRPEVRAMGSFTDTE